eukprot:scaffold211649_cov34-Tisochrysis_lutea.AAC.1
MPAKWRRRGRGVCAVLAPHEGSRESGDIRMTFCLPNVESMQVRTNYASNKRRGQSDTSLKAFSALAHTRLERMDSFRMVAYPPIYCGRKLPTLQASSIPVVEGQGVYGLPEGAERLQSEKIHPVSGDEHIS